MLLRDLLGANIKVVSGYKGTADVRLAMESGEIDGIMNSWESIQGYVPGQGQKRRLATPRAVGRSAPIAALPVKNVPTIPQIAKTEEQQQLLRFGASRAQSVRQSLCRSPRHAGRTRRGIGVGVDQNLRRQRIPGRSGERQARYRSGVGDAGAEAGQRVFWIAGGAESEIEKDP